MGGNNGQPGQAIGRGYDASRGYSGDMPTPMASPATPIEIELTQQNQTLEMLVQAVGALERKLQPVLPVGLLSKVEPAAATNAPPAPPDVAPVSDSHVGRMVNAQANVASQLLRRVNRLVDHVEL